MDITSRQISYLMYLAYDVQLEDVVSHRKQYILYLYSLNQILNQEVCFI